MLESRTETILQIALKF